MSIPGLSQLEIATDLPITLEKAKKQVRVLNNATEDDLIADYIGYATEHIETELKRSLMPQKWRYKVNGFPPSTCPIACDDWRSCAGVCEHIGIKLMRPPIISIEAFTYTNTDGDTVAMVEDTDYKLIRACDTANPPLLVPVFDGNWPDNRNYFESITIDYSAGHDDAPGREIRQVYLQAIKLLVATAYENRESIASAGALMELPQSMTVKRMLQRFRAWSL